MQMPTIGQEESLIITEQLDEVELGDLQNNRSHMISNTPNILSPSFTHIPRIETINV